MLKTTGEELERKSVREMSLEEIISEIRQLEEELPRPFVQVVTKMIRSKGKYYAYAYLQWRDGETVRTVYLGKRVPEEILGRILLQGRLKGLKKELKMAGVRTRGGESGEGEENDGGASRKGEEGAKAHSG